MSIGSTPAAIGSQQNGHAMERPGLAVQIFLFVQLFVVVWLQKIAIPGVGLDIALVFMGTGLILLGALRRLQISAKRLAAYSVFAVSVITVQFLGSQPFSAASVLLLLVCYLPIVMRFEMSWPQYLGVIRCFIVFTVIASVFILTEDAWQYVQGAALLPSMDKVLPQAWIIQGYTYLQPIYWGSAYIKPNAFFFREVSFVSQYCALGLILEAVFFRRALVMLLLLAGVFASFAGTGLLLLLLIAPFLFVRLPLKSGALLAAVAIAVVAVALSTGWLGNVQRRLTETSDPRSSSSMRFVYPLKLLKDRIGVDANPLTGVGAGNMFRETSGKGDLLPITKLLLEFGLIATAAYYFMLLYALFEGAPSRRVALALFILLNICGPYLEVSTIVFLVLLLGTAMRPTDGAPAASRQARSGRLKSARRTQAV